MLGEFIAPHTIYIYTWGAPAVEVNNTLCHELRHYEQLLQHRQKYEHTLQEYQQLKGRRARRAYFDAHLFLADAPPSDAHLPYWSRPREQDACAFADEHAPRQLLVQPQQAFAVLLPLALAQACESALLAWLKHRGGSLLKRHRDALVYYLSNEDIALLEKLLQRRGQRPVTVMADARGIPIMRLQKDHGAAVIVPYPVQMIPASAGPAVGM